MWTGPPTTRMFRFHLPERDGPVRHKRRKDQRRRRKPFLHVEEGLFLRKEKKKKTAEHYKTVSAGLAQGGVGWLPKTQGDPCHRRCSVTGPRRLGRDLGHMTRGADEPESLGGPRL